MLTIQNWFLSAITFAGGLGVVFYLLFQYLGKTWLENKFSQRLDYLRHEQDKEIAKLRIQIESMLNGALILQEKEFEILPKLWELTEKCFLQLLFVTSSERMFADIDRMNELQVEELLALTQFPESQKAQIREAKVKSTLYKSFLTYERATDAYNTSTELGNYLSLNGILIPLELKDKCHAITGPLTMYAHQIRAIVVHKLPTPIYDFHEKVEEQRPLLDEIEATIQSRLASHARSFNGN